MGIDHQNIIKQANEELAQIFGQNRGHRSKLIKLHKAYAKQQYELFEDGTHFTSRGYAILNRHMKNRGNINTP